MAFPAEGVDLLDKQQLPARYRLAEMTAAALAFKTMHPCRRGLIITDGKNDGRATQ
jgi:hypothetical protein